MGQKPAPNQLNYARPVYRRGSPSDRAMVWLRRALVMVWIVVALVILFSFGLLVNEFLSPDLRAP